MWAKSALTRNLVAEFVASFMFGLFGLGLVAIAVTAGGVINLFELSFLFGIMLMVIIYVTGAISGTHINPAVTITMAVFGGFNKKWVVPFIVAQILGWTVGTLVLYYMWEPMIVAFESANGIIRGEAGSEATAMIFHCFAPHPTIAPTMGWDNTVVTTGRAILFEVLCGIPLSIYLLGTGYHKNAGKPQGWMNAFLIAMLIAFLVVLFSPMTMAAINPARDLGPRITAWLMGWGEISFPGNASGEGGPWYIFTVGPILGNLLGGAIWTYILKPCHDAAHDDANAAVTEEAESEIEA